MSTESTQTAVIPSRTPVAVSRPDRIAFRGHVTRRRVVGDVLRIDGGMTLLRVGGTWQEGRREGGWIVRVKSHLLGR